jgi:hypothetical protein
MVADTPSPPAASTPDVGTRAVVLAWVIAEPIFDKSEAAAATNSGAAIRKDN